MKDHYLESGGIAYRTNTLEPSRPTLVFIHGLSGTCLAWLPFEKHFEHTYNVVTYDLRGHGLSKRYPHLSDYAIENFTEDLQQLLAHLHIDSCMLISHSFGTLIALEFLANNKIAIQKNIFLSPNYKTHSYPFHQLIYPFLWFATVLYSVLPTLRAPGKRIDYENLPRPSPDWSLRRIVPEIHAMTNRIYLYCLRHIYEYKRDTKWSEITTPTLMLHGSEDSFVPIRYGRAVATLVPNATLRELKGANHMLVLNNVAEITTAIEAFIR